MNVLSLRLACVLWAASLCGPASASIAIHEHGNGIKALGFGGVGYGVAEETTAIAANPAHSSSLAGRYDLGLDFFLPRAEARIRGGRHQLS